MSCGMGAEHGIGRRTIAVAIAVSIARTLVPMTIASATTDDSLGGQLEQAREELSQASSDIEKLEGEIQEAEGRIVEITKQLPERRTSAADTMKTLYKEMSTHNLHLGIIMNSDSIQQMMDQLIALEDVQNESFGQINNLTSEMARCAEENVRRNERLEIVRADLPEMESRVSELEDRMERIRNAPPALDGCEPIDWSMSDEEIIAEWAPRIDAYLKGYPLEGYGETFVKAGIKYGVDPRFSVAISNTESTRGLYCFSPYNAWGWMSMAGRFSSWEEAIYAHSEYLTCDYYHARLDAQTAQTYCPPTWQSWLENTLNAARSI